MAMRYLAARKTQSNEQSGGLTPSEVVGTRARGFEEVYRLANHL